MNIRQNSKSKNQHTSAIWLQQINELTQNTVSINNIKRQTEQRLRQIPILFTLPDKQLTKWLEMSEPIQLAKKNFINMMKNGILSLAKNDHKIYCGGVQNKKKKGIGILIEKGKSYYEGQFQDNDRQGRGVQIYQNENVYLGNFQKNKKHGTGQFFWFNLSINSLFYELYDGQWWGGLPDGRGLHQKNNGDLFLGQFKNGLKHGMGHQKMNNLDSYNGAYVNGAKQGKGTYTWKNGNIYQGEFKQGFKDGKGVWISPTTNEKYDGEYRKDRKNGFGIYKWGFDLMYKGYYKDDKRHGFGELIQGNQIKYCGQWVNDEIQNKNSINIEEFKESPSGVKLFKKRKSRVHTSYELRKSSYKTMSKFPSINGQNNRRIIPNEEKKKFMFKTRIKSEQGEYKQIHDNQDLIRIKISDKIKLKKKIKSKSVSEKKKIKIRTSKQRSLNRMKKPFCKKQRCYKINCGCNDPMKPEQPFQCRLDAGPTSSLSKLDMYFQKL